MTLFLNNTGRMRAGFQVLVFYLFGLVLAVVLQTVLKIFGPASSLAYQAVLYPLEAAGLFGISVLAFSLLSDGNVAPLGLQSASAVRSGACGAVSALVAISVVFVALWWPLRAACPLGVEWRLVSSKPFWLGLITFFFAAAFEELGFRGFPFLVLRKSMGRWGATAFLSVLFVGVHPNFYHSPAALITIFLGGILLTQLFVLTGSLWGAIGFHFLWNFSQYIVFPLPGQGRSLIRARDFDPAMHGLTVGIEESWWAAGVLLVLVVCAEGFLWRQRSDRAPE